MEQKQNLARTQTLTDSSLKLGRPEVKGFSSSNFFKMICYFTLEIPVGSWLIFFFQLI